MAGAGAIGGLFEFVGAGAKYAVSQSLAKKQKDEADKKRREATQIKAPELLQQYKDIEKMKALQTLMGLPGKDAYNAEIEQSGATALRTGQEGASSGSEYLDYASKIYDSELKAKRDLKMQDTTFRAGAINDYSKTLEMIGNEEKANDAIKRAQQEELLKQSSALENASTANEYQGKTDAIGDFVSAGASIAGGLSGGGMGGMGGGAGKMGGGAASGANAGAMAGATSSQAAPASVYPSYKNDAQLSSTDEMMIQNMMTKYGMTREQAIAEFMKNRQVH